RRSRALGDIAVTYDRLGRRTDCVRTLLAAEQAARIWREEAEAQKERADRLASDLTEIKNRLTRIEQENARLIQLLTSLDPARLAVIRLADNPPETT
ncbi:hypothetical protein, partial [Streptomyces prunicolor]|uniref:hypothetical protein n=1 Tax=Streptomyces prunicolor TaxID=67348 RepID=UPI0033CF0446